MFFNADKRKGEEKNGCYFKDGSLGEQSFEDRDGARTFRHTTSHILAQAVKKLYPDAKLAIGPAIDDGFYYDFEFSSPISSDDFKAIEKEMKKIVKERLPMERFTLPREEAIALMKERNESYKVELIEDLPEDAVISFSGRVILWICAQGLIFPIPAM